MEIYLCGATTQVAKSQHAKMVGIYDVNRFSSIDFCDPIVVNFLTQRRPSHEEVDESLRRKELFALGVNILR